jgi:predicted DNA-binding transcriptional regulator AlpA
MDNTTIPETGFIRLPDVLRVFPVSKSTWWAGVKTGRFPAGVKLGPRMTAWRVEDIRALIQNPAVKP